MFVVCVVYCVGSGISDDLITNSEEFYLVCVSNCVWSRSLNREDV
jgi:hypothetical protein